MSLNEERQPLRIKILLVDDERGYVDVLGKRMAKRFIDVTPAFSGGDAIRMLRKQDFDVAILDLKLEDMDGLEVLKIFRIMDPQLPVIMLTGHGSEKAAHEGIGFGAHDYLAKPCDLDELVDKIRQAFEARR